MALPPWPTVARLLRTALSFDASAIYPWGAVRAAAVLAGVLAVGLGWYGPGVAAPAGLGALMAGVVSISRTNRRPLHTMAATTAGIAVSVFVGSAAGSPAYLHVALLALWAFGGGLLIALGDAGGAIGIQGTISFIVLGRFAEPPGTAAKLAAYAAAGGVVQLVVAGVTRWTSALERQRRAVAEAYRRLADAAGGQGSSLPAGDALDMASMALSSPSLFRRPDLLPLRSLVEEGRRMRIEIAALNGLRDQLRRGQNSYPSLDPALTHAAAVLRGVAAVVSEGHLDPDDLRSEADQVLDRADPVASGSHLLLDQARKQLRSLAGQLRAVISIAEHSQKSGSRLALVAGERVAVADLPGRVRAQLALLAANLSFTSTACRHALRLAAVVVAAEVVGNHIPLQRGYWIPVTATIVLRPDFAATWTRGVSRLVGTLMGAAATGLLAETVHVRGGWAVLAIGVVGFAAFVTFPASYAAYTACLTGLTVLLVSLATPGTLATTGDRLVDTVIGGALSLAAYAVWPTWSEADARRAVAYLAEAERDYVVAVLSSLGQPAVTAHRDLGGLARRLRLARTNADAAVRRAVAEPGRHSLDTGMADAVLDGLRRTGLASHALRTGLDRGTAPVVDPAFIAAVSKTLDLIASWASTRERVAGRPDLRALHEELVPSLGGDAPGRFVALETDELVDAIDTVAEAFIGSEGMPSAV